jgi:hypothetical protein
METIYLWKKSTKLKYLFFQFESYLIKQIYMEMFINDFEYVIDPDLNLTCDELPSSLINSNVNMRWKQRKNKELGHAPWLAALWG